VSVIGVDQTSARGLERPRAISRGRSGADRAYRGVATGAGLLTLVILFLIGLFLLIRSLPAFRLMGWAFFTTSTWEPDGIKHQFGVAAVLYWTFIIAIVALVIAVPISIACALFINEYASRRFRRPLTAVVDLLAAIPSVIYGIWGLVFLQPHLVAVSAWLSTNLGFIPIFKTSGVNYTGSAFIAGVVVSLMVMPICTSVMREVFSQTPPGEKEAALALPRGRPPFRARRDHRRRNARLRPGARRDDRGGADHLDVLHGVARDPQRPGCELGCGVDRPVFR
jgi:phosphate transport system permease protein